jgi:AmiR/NasT family two-component response regulator
MLSCICGTRCVQAGHAGLAPHVAAKTPRLVCSPGRLSPAPKRGHEGQEIVSDKWSIGRPTPPFTTAGGEAFGVAPAGASQGVTQALVELSEIPAGQAHPGTVLQLLADRVVQLFEVDDATVVVADEHARPQVAAASTQPAGALTQTALQLGEGPAVDCLRSGHLQVCGNLPDSNCCWPRYAAAAVGLGYTAVQALPIQHQTQTIGAAVLLRRGAGLLEDQELTGVHALAAAASIHLSHHHELHRRNQTIHQLQTALDSRVIVEQAKGILAGRRNVTIDQAFHLMRRHARNHNHKLREVAQAVMDNDPDSQALSRPRQIELKDSTPEVHQAVGVLAGRKRISVEQAWNELRSYAHSHAMPLTTVAKTILNQTRAHNDAAPK